MEDFWFVVVGVGVMFSAVVPNFLLIVISLLHGVLEIFGYLIISSVLNG